MFITSRTSCSMSRTVMPCARIDSMSARSPRDSAAFIPAAGSSSARGFGAVARARATVLDEQDRDALRADRFDERAEPGGLGGIHPRRRLVQREELGRGREGACHLQAALVSVGQASRRIVGTGADADELEQLQRAPLGVALLAQGRAVSQDRADDAGPGARVPADHHVLERRKVGEQADVLEGARDAGDRHLMGRQPAQRLVVEREAPAVGRVDPGEHVEERGLAGAVGADQAEDFPGRDLERHFAQRLHAAEALADPRRAEPAHEVSSRLRTAEGSSPAGRNSMMSTSASPKISMRMTSGSTSSRPNSASCSGSTVQRRISGTNESSTAPRITPQMLPIPPSTTIATTMMDSTRTKLSGEMNPCIAENMPPARPPKLAPMVKASSFRLRVLMPIARAAISSSRIASQARPMREFCSRILTTMTPSVIATSRK